jgi:Uma2 family endonuclease
MTTALNPPEQLTQSVTLNNVSWALYRQLQAERGDDCGRRVAYDRGRLEITVPSFSHEQINRTIAELFAMIADESGLDFINAGSTTFEREDLEQGFEPDTCFYIQNAERVRGQEQIRLAADPPPDLIIEVDFAHSSLNKFPIYAGLGIPEVWRYRKGRLIVLKLEGGAYREQAESAALPGVTSDDLTRLLAESREQKRLEWVRRVRDFARGLKTRTD